MESEAKRIRDRSIDLLRDCEATLQRVAETCCMPERSVLMAGAAGTLRDALAALESGRSGREALPKGLESVTRCGGQIGELYVTCCTETREPLYRKILEGLNRVHANIEKILTGSP
jgi:hypothetical protein